MNIENCWYKDVCSRECNAHCLRFKEMNFLMEHSNLPVAMQKPIPLVAPQVDVSQYKQLAEIKNNIVDFVNNGRNLYITSMNCGNGKTSWAIKLLTKYFDSIWAGNGLRVRGLFIHVPTFFMQMKNNISDRDEQFIEVRDSINTADLVVWDEVANTAMTKYEYEQFLAYVDYRILANKSNIFTSNVPDMQNVEKILGSKLASRIYNGSTVIELRGRDMRNGTATSNQ